MGISDFYPTFKEMSPQAFQTINFSDLAGWRIAVDVSIFLYKFVKSGGNIGDGYMSWLDGFILFVNTLRKNGVKAVFVFDGPNPPVEKKEEQTRRRLDVEKSKQRISDLEKLFEDISFRKDENLTNVDDIVVKLKELFPRKHFGENIGTIYAEVHALIDKVNRQTTSITKEHAAIAKEFIELMGLCWIQADGEAEGLCAYLAHRGDVDGVMSEDTDALLYGTPYLFSKIDVANSKCCATRLNDILELNRLTFKEFQDVCIMFGVDYNERCRYVSEGKLKCVGPKTALKLVREFGTIDSFHHILENEGESLKWKRCREIFTVPDLIPDTLISFNKPIDTVGLERFLSVHFTKPRYLEKLKGECTFPISWE